MYLDDLGKEDKAYNREEIMGRLLFERHRRSLKTYVTTKDNPSAGICGILGLGLLGYFGYTSNEKIEQNFEVYRMIMESQNKLHEDYFAAYPEIKEDYCQLLEAEK